MQERLFRLAVEAGMVTFHHVPREGWTLTVCLRRGDESFDDAVRERYSGLTTVELLDVVSASLDASL